MDLDGETVTNDLFAEKDLTVLNVWGTFCGPCVAEMPELGDWAEELPDGAAFGLLLLDENEHMLRPLVYLKGVSMIWERGCGSGTAAVGAYLAWKNRKAVSMELQQPGGKMRAEAGYQDGVIPALYIAGHVSIVAEGIAFLEG